MKRRCGAPCNSSRARGAQGRHASWKPKERSR